VRVMTMFVVAVVVAVVVVVAHTSVASYSVGLFLIIVLGESINGISINVDAFPAPFCTLSSDVCASGHSSC